MPAEQTPTELTTRDVLLQVDRRLTLIEDDLRTQDQKWDPAIRRCGSKDRRPNQSTAPRNEHRGLRDYAKK